MEPDDGAEDEGPFSVWLPPDDRLWRHPSEITPLDEVGFGRHVDAAGSHRHLLAVLGGQGRTWAVAVVAGVVGALLASGVSMATGHFGSRTTVLQAVTRVVTPDTVSLATQAAAGSGNANWPAVADALTASVVSITAAATGAAGSGVVWATAEHRTYVLTADALVAGGGAVQVTFAGGQTETASVVGEDPKSGLAVLWVLGGNRPSPNFGTVAGLKVAQPLLALAGGQDNAATASPLSVSSLDQAVVTSDEQTMVGMVAVTGPSSIDQGGPLVDASGNVVGVATSVASAGTAPSGLSYAVPIDVAEHVAQQIVDHRRVTHPYVGVLASADLSSVTARQLGVGGGARVQSLAPGSPAAKAGLSSNDVITALAGKPVTGAGSLLSVLDKTRPGSSVRIAYLHQGKPASITVRVSEQPSSINGA